MIPDKPDAASLLETAAEVFKRDLLPTVPEDKVLDALMILSVIGSAQREILDGDGLAQRQAERLEAVLPGGTGRDLCEAIREGDFDSADDAARLHAILLEDVRDRLSLVNPKYLESADHIPS